MTSQDGYVDANDAAKAATEEEASADSQEDVESEETESKETEKEETEETEDENSLTDEQVKAINSFGKLDEEARLTKVKKMLGSGRADQIEKAKLLQENFSMEVEEKQETDITEAVAQSLKAMGLDPEAIEEMKVKQEQSKQSTAVKEWAEVTGLNHKKVLKNKDFVKAYHSSSKESVSGKVDDAIKAYLKTISLPNAKKAQATKDLSSIVKGNAKPQKKASTFTDFSKIEGKTLDEIDLDSL